MRKIHDSPDSLWRGTLQNWRPIAATLTVFAAGGWLCMRGTMNGNETWRLLVNTILFSGGSVLLALPIGTAIACWLDFQRQDGRHPFLLAVMSLLFMPPYIQVAGWEATFGLQGWVSRWVWPHASTAFLSGWRGALWMQTLINVPWVVLIVSAVRARLPASYEEWATLQGSPWRVFRLIVLPQLRPALTAIALWLFVMSATDITITDIYQIHTFAEEVYTGFALGDDFRQVIVRNATGTSLVVLLAIMAFRSSRQMRIWLRTRQRLQRRERSCTSARFARIGVVSLLALFWIGVPMGSLLFQAGLQVVRLGTAYQRHWSAPQAVRMVVGAPFHFREEFAWSLVLAQLVSVTVLPAAIFLAWQVRGRPRMRITANLATALLLAIPGPLLALAVAWPFNQPAADRLFYLYDRTLFVPWTALSLRLFPLVFLVLEPWVAGLETRPRDVLRTMGAGGWATWRHGVWPPISAAIPCIWLAVMAAAMADLSTTILAVPPGITTLSIRVFNLVHYGVTDQLAGLCLSAFVLFGGLAWLVQSFWPPTAVRPSIPGTPGTDDRTEL